MTELRTRLDQLIALILCIVCMAFCARPTFAQCPNDFCDTATSLDLCAPASFDNHDCTTEQLCVSPHPASGNCSYDWQYNSQWYSFEVVEAGLYQLELTTNFTGNTVGWNTCLPMFEGSSWALLKGSCTNFIVNSINFNSQHLCFCPGIPFPSGAGASVASCNESPCGQTYQLGPYWQSIGLFPQDIDSDPPYQPYTPCRQYHHVEFYLTPDIYYIQITSVGLSEGDGSIEVCGPWGPLSTKPELFYRNSRLEWEGNTQTDWTVFELIDLNWTEIARTTDRHLEINESGYYIVGGSSGFSNQIHVKMPGDKKGYGFNLKGQETDNMWMK